MIILFLAWLAFADIAAVKPEPDLNKRSELALANAERGLDQAKQAYTSGDARSEHAALDEILESVEVSFDALRQGHETPRKSKYYKRAELKVQALLRRLGSFRDDVDVDERDAVQKVMGRLQQIHDEILAEIMSKKRK